MTASKKQEIFNYLKDVGCCNVCCLRYFNGRGEEYNNTYNAFQFVGIWCTPPFSVLILYTSARN